MILKNMSSCVRRQISMNASARRGPAPAGRSASTRWAPTCARGTPSTAAGGTTSTRRARAASVRRERQLTVSSRTKHRTDPPPAYHGVSLLSLPPPTPPPHTDIDECKAIETVCSGHGCVNLIGSFRCECEAGYIFNSISRTCEGEQPVRLA